MNAMASQNNFPVISGGDIRWMEIAKIWQKKGYTIHVYTPRIGIELCKRFNLKANFHLFNVPDKYGISSYFRRALKSFNLPDSLNNFKGIIYTSTEHCYDVIPAVKIKKKNPDNQLITVAHWVAPLFRRGTSIINSILFYINQRIGFYNIRKYSDKILAVSDSTAKQLMEINLPKIKIKSVGCGVKYKEIRDIAKDIHKKEYDAIFMKRFDGTKGIFDIIEIWSDVVKERKHAKLGLIGLGTNDVMKKLQDMIKRYNLQKNILFFGPIYDNTKKFSILCKSRIFVLPSYEENWAIVIGEAMASGIPVICYNIPEIKPIWEDKIIWIEKGNKIEFSKKILHLLNNEELKKQMQKKGLDFIKKYDWESIAEEELNLIKNG
jgi:glycosyltransferase involved in cell wall biosynthesis